MKNKVRNIVRNLKPPTILLILLFTSLASANDAPLQLIGGGFTPGPGVHTNVQMDSETVIIRLDASSYMVDATFWLTNKGATTTEWVGFPKKGLGYFGDFKKVSEFIDFQTWVDGEKVPFAEKGGASSVRATDQTLPDLIAGVKTGTGGNLFVEDVRWLVKTVSFPAGQTKVVRVRYTAPYNKKVPCDLAHYIYGTGSFWAGKIGKATFIIETTRQEVPGIYIRDKAEESRISKTSTKYTLHDFEPAEDAEIVITLCPAEGLQDSSQATQK